MPKLKPKRLTGNKLAWTLVLAVLLTIGILAVYLQFASATFTGNNGDVSWGDTTLGRPRVSALTYSLTSPFGAFGTSFRQAAPVSSAVQFIETKSSPTRNEKLIGYQLNDGRLYVAKCISTCSAQANLTASAWSWTTPAILGTNVVTRAFDIAYEQESGRAMVVYAGNTTGKLYYCIYDGGSWGPVSSCAPTNGVNDISLTDGTTTLTGTPAWVRLVPQGAQFGPIRTNNILLAVQDTNNDIFTISWNGSSWNTSDSQVLTTTGGATIATTNSGTQSPPAFDIGWESLSGAEMAVYANGTALSYRTSSGSGWSGATTITTLASAAQWIRVGSDPQSNRMSMIVAFGSTGTVGSTATATPYIWKTNGTSAAWTAFTNLTMAQDAGQNIDTVWEKSNTGNPKAIFSSSSNSNTQQPDWSSWTSSGFVAWAASVTTSGDIIVSNELQASPNNDVINLMQADRDGKLRARNFNGSTWGSLITTNLSTTMINTTTGKTNNTTFIQKPFQYTQKPYATWSLNWRFFQDNPTTGNPGTPLANEDTQATVQPSETFRLRMNYAELGGGAEGDTRKKLQFSSGAGCPDSPSCSWTDVGNIGGGAIWLYASGPTDNTVISSSELDGTSAAGSGGNGYVVNSGTASATGDSQIANSVQEYDYALKNNGATVGTTYYFRGYDFGPSLSGGTASNLTAIYREQIFNTAGVEQTNCTDGTGPQTCTYPTVFPNSVNPNPPTFYFPLDGSSNSTSTPTIELKAVDVLGNPLEYVVEWCPVNSFPCASGGGSFDQTASQTNWAGQDANGGTAYVAQINEANSTMGLYTVNPGVFLPTTTYYLRAKAYDPSLAVYGSYSSSVGFTTSALSVLIQGGATIKGGTIIAN